MDAAGEPLPANDKLRPVLVKKRYPEGSEGWKRQVRRAPFVADGAPPPSVELISDDDDGSLIYRVRFCGREYAWGADEEKGRRLEGDDYTWQSRGDGGVAVRVFTPSWYICYNNCGGAMLHVNAYDGPETAYRQEVNPWWGKDIDGWVRDDNEELVDAAASPL